MSMSSAYQALPLPFATAGAPSPVRPYPASHPGVPEPVPLPWGLKPMGSAQFGQDRLSDGRMRLWIRHEVVKGVTPRMLAWWFANLEGDVIVQGRPVNRYRVWHPYDHVHASYSRRLADGSIGPGAVIRLKEILGGDPRFVVNVETSIEKLDEEGYIHNPILHGISGLARMEYTFKAVPGGTLYENCLIVGARRGAARWLQPLWQRFAFPDGKAQAWIRHNIEEVGMFENFLPQLYREQTDQEG
ncbi:MAG: hypothetical protein Q8R06_13485 [Polaromonas sp.]|uniref:DAPG hydrolase family protein n=1 Tax=Polaromonas sp. TaxID=1869339 RepID=UPI002731FEEB|nr:hypothetical protein [Polaromonas sp.]MDP1739985.1 hypothetical protein [Polaromonas sp.]MDP1954702.1 hypothetical protein [Polaromonas sp.]MDP3798138.1 hypothetical protein [Polaromonas sp.]